MSKQKHPKSAPEHLGEVTIPSGTAIVIDAGLLKFWCHDRPPLMQEGTASDTVVEAANGGADFRIEGPDAERAARAFDRQWHPGYLFDIPKHGLEQIAQSFADCVREHGLNARVVRAAERITHRRRVDLALEYGHGAGEMFFQGITASVMNGLPRERPLRVLGERMPAGQYEDRWRRVFLECLPEGEIAHSELVGRAAVDEARLMFADVDALGTWEHNKPLDGLADYVFWGRDAAPVAQRTQAPQLGESQWGWVDLPIREAAQRGMAVEELCDQQGFKLAGDFRPHSHHYLVMKEVRATPTESGTIEVGGARVCAFMTTWGDGFYSVFREVDAAGRLVRISIDLGNDEIVARQKRMENR
jgi:hypothetical protein